MSNARISRARIRGYEMQEAMRLGRIFSDEPTAPPEELTREERTMAALAYSFRCKKYTSKNRHKKTPSRCSNIDRGRMMENHQISIG